MKAYERLLKYVVIKTPSCVANASSTPSSACQFNLAYVLSDEMKELGLSDVYVSDKCYVYGKLPATSGYEDRDCIGFIAHMDTVEEFTNDDICPVLHQNYDGNDVILGDSGRVIDVKTFPHLPSLAGRTLITTDGNTVLGADDKAGIAEILTLIEELINNEIPHGPIAVAFTPDEEIGSGAEDLDLARFGAKYAYTLDGDTEGEIQYENFNACSAVFDITGLSVHPGDSKDKMINASLVAMEINGMLPSAEIPRNTEMYEGFYHLTDMKGDCGKAELHYIVRDHDASRFASRKETLKHIEKIMNETWGASTVKLTLKDQYQNMSEIIQDGNMHLIDHAKKACELAGIVPIVSPIRGGTDGCQLSYRGLPCPNLGTGGHGFHGPYEHITVEGMDLVVKMLVELVKLNI